jgi:2,5-diamino-6-(ribosylamino)-4(3H)-pyrimidinone 5'-phosphate reductase
MQQLFPVTPTALDPDTVYTIPALAFPSEGVALDEPGQRRPYVYFNMVSSVDGKAVMAGGNVVGLGGPLDKQLMRRLRTASDAVMVGAETLRRDLFVPVIPPELAEERACYFPNEPQPWGIVISRDGNLPLEKKFFQGVADLEPKRRLVALGQAASPAAEAALSHYARIVRVPDWQGQPDVSWLLNYLYTELGIRHLLCEGGPTLNYSLISRGLGDELFLTQALKLIGGTSSTILTGPGPFPTEKIPPLKLISLYQHATELFFRYRIEHPEDSNR